MQPLTQDQLDARRWRAVKARRPYAFYRFMCGGTSYSNQTAPAIIDAAADAMAEEVESDTELSAKEHAQIYADRVEKRKRALEEEYTT